MIVSGFRRMVASTCTRLDLPRQHGRSGAVYLWKEQQMRFLRIRLVVLASLAMISSAILQTNNVSAQNQASALERGYRTGYSDGFNAGFKDVSDRAPRNYENKDDYQRADRNFNQAWGTIEDYRDGYQQGFETGYIHAYDRRPFNSAIPTDLSRRGTVASGSVAADNTDPQDTQPTNNTNSTNPVYSPSSTAPLVIRRDEILLIEMISSLSTEASQQGDRFQARVLQPRELEGAIVEGRVTRVKRAGKVKGTSELQLAFESIRLNAGDNRTFGFSAGVVEVIDMGGNSSSATVDDEGGVRGQDSTKGDVTKVGASTGIGAIIGAIVGGGKGAAIGAAIGGSVGTAGVLSSRGKDLRLPQGQQLRIRSATETRIQ